MNVKFKAVYASEVQSFFSSLGLLAQLEKGELQCGNCGTVITLENFGSAYKKSGRLIFTCDSLACIGPVREPENMEE